jgi:hypothetical protein
VAVLEVRVLEKHLLQGPEAIEAGAEKGHPHAPVSETRYHRVLQKDAICLEINAEISKTVIELIIY